MISILIFARAIARFWFATRVYKNGSGHLNTSAGETVLVVGVNTVAELYLLSLQEFASHRIQVAGILAEDPTMRGRLIRQNAVLGTVDELPNVLQSLEIHGVTVDRIVVATAVDRLLPRALEALLEIEKSSNIVVHFLSDRLGFTNASEKPPILAESERSIVDGQIPRSLVGDLTNANFARKPFRLKRTVDSLGAAFLMVTLAPIAAVIAVIVALDVGFPLIFWQQRPGLCGRPFRMYKFRTMRAAHDKHGTRIADAQRSSAIGRILRSTRLDELPQLYNVLVGDMSFVGPRPLLPHDQHPNYAARLSVRPGITGWAQVNGGRIISDPDKWILDIWYVQNASLLVDFKIILGTVKMVLFGDRINAEAIRQAKSDLGLKTLLPAE